MFYDYHCTKKSERMALMQGTDFVWKKVRPADLIKVQDEADRGKSVVWEEDTGRFYEIPYIHRLETLRQYDKDKNIDYQQTAYYKYWVSVKGDEYCRVRIANFFALYENIKQNGFKKIDTDSVCVEATGEKLDGQHRASIALHLGIKEIEVKEYSFKWQDIDEDFIKRKLAARQFSFGPNYYFIEYKEGVDNFQGIGKYSKVYSENSYDRWEVIKGLVEGQKILDLGCNEGFMSIMLAKEKKEVLGVDYKFIEGANLNKLIFEFYQKKKLNVSFQENDISDMDFVEDYDTTLLLNTIYHIPKDKQLDLLKRLRPRTKAIIMQGNLRKLKEHDRFYGITIEDMTSLLNRAGFQVVNIINWRDKPIIVAK